MLVDPAVYISLQIDKSYEELLKERNKLIYKIKKYEKNSKNNLIISFGISPSEELIYLHNHLYLAKLCELIVDKYKEVN